MADFFCRPLFILEMANNHMGVVDHGLRIIQEFGEVVNEFKSEFNFAFKFQFRYLDTFIHKNYEKLPASKYPQRFLSTQLTISQFKVLLAEVEKWGFITAATPFDEPSVELISALKVDITKVASCSVNDWPLLEKMVLTDGPFILSTAGANAEQIDSVVTFFDNRNKKISLMHCVGIYPTPDECLQLNQIDYLKNRYPKVMIGYSTHERPDNLDAIKMAIAKGASVFERHVGISSEKYKLNHYSSTPSQIKKWLSAAKEAYEYGGSSSKIRSIFTNSETLSLSELKRGAFAKKKILSGEKVSTRDVYFAIPNLKGQLLSNDFSKYNNLTALQSIDADHPLMVDAFHVKNTREKVESIMEKVKGILKEAKIPLPDRVQIEISHHYGLDHFDEIGATIINCINREYCKKLLVVLPGQSYPMHFHKRKEETFHVYHGEIWVQLDGTPSRLLKPGEMIVIERGAAHKFYSQSGGIFEEVSTTHFKDDSFYFDKRIGESSSRKTEMTLWTNWYNR